MNVWRSWAETRVLTMTFSNMKLKRTGRMSLLILCRNFQKWVWFVHAVTPVCQTVVHHFYGCQVTINNGASVGCFSVKQQLNTVRSLPLPYLYLWFRFTTAVTTNTMIWKFLSLNYVVCLQWFVMVLQKTVGPFFLFHWCKKIVRNAEACVWLFNCNE